MRRIQGPPFGPSPRGDKRRCRLLTWPATRRCQRLACRPRGLGVSLSLCRPGSWGPGMHFVTKTDDTCPALGQDARRCHFLGST